MVLAHEHVHARVEQGSVGHVGVVERLLQHAPVEVVGVQDAHFAAERAHVVDDLGRGAFAQDELVLLALAAFHHVRQRHAAVAAREHGDAQLLLKLLDGGREVRLRRVQVLRRRVDGAVLRDGDEVAQLLQGHGGSILSWKASERKPPAPSS